jgi:hypothetical protein
MNTRNITFLQQQQQQQQFTLQYRLNENQFSLPFMAVILSYS